MDEDSNIDFTAKLCFFNGIPFIRPEKYKNLNGSYTLFWYFYVVVPFAMTVLFFTSASMQIYFSYQDQMIMIYGIFCTYFTSFSWKLLFIILKRDQYEKVYYKIRTLASEFSLRNDGYDKIHKFYYEPIKKLGTVTLYFIMVISFGYIVGVCIRSFFVGKEFRYLPVKVWTPYDAYENPAYVFTVTMQGIGGGFLVSRNTVVDIIPLTILTIPKAQLRYLHRALEKMFREPKEINDFEKEFAWWIKSHQRVLDTLKDFKQICSYYLCTTYIGAMVDLFLVGLAITTPNLEWDIFKSMTIIGNILVPAVQLYILCVIADTLTDTGLATVTDAMSLKLMYSRKRVKSSILFAALRSTRPIRFTAAGLYPLCVETFRDMIRLTVTYFVTVVQIRARFSGNRESYN